MDSRSIIISISWIVLINIIGIGFTTSAPTEDSNGTDIVTPVDTESLKKSLSSLIDYQISEIARINNKRKQNGQEIIQNIDSFATDVQKLKDNVAGLENYLRQLAHESSPTSSGFPVIGGNNGIVVLYRHLGQEGSSVTLDFTGCTWGTVCCKNLDQFNIDNDAMSIDTKGSCVEMFLDDECRGDSRKFYPGSDYSHNDFGSMNNKLSSAKPC